MKLVKFILLLIIPTLIYGQEGNDLSSFQDTIYFDQSSGNYIIKYLGDSSVGELDTIITMSFVPPTKVDPKINAKVNFVTDSSYYLYSYKITNGELAEENIISFTIFFNERIKIQNKQSNNYHGGRYNTVYNDIAWWGDGGLEPTWSADGFAISSEHLPGIGRAGFKGYTPILSYEHGRPSRKIEEKLLNLSVKEESFVYKSTVIPVIINYFTFIDFLDTLKTYTDSSYALGWIKDEQTRDKYDNYFSTAKTYLEQGDSSTARAELQKVLTDCNMDSLTVLTSEAYALLYFNTEYLVNKLPEGEPFPQNDIDAKVKAKVIKKKNGNLKYKYKLKNKPESTQDISLFYLKEKTDSVKLHSPTGWTNSVIEESSLVSFRADSEGVEIKPGDNLKWFTVKAKELPYLGNYYIQSARSSVDLNDIYTNSATGVTLSATLPPSPFVAVEFIDTLKELTTKAYELGWIKKEKLYARLINKLNKAKEKLENGKERKAKEIVSNYVQTVRRKWCKRKITSEGLALLKFNGQYLAKHIGPPNLEDNLAGVTVVEVERLNSNENRRYEYKLSNSVNSAQNIYSLYIEENVEGYTTKEPEEWTETSIDTLNLVGYKTTAASAMIKPDKKKKGYKIKVESLPAIMAYYILTENQPAETDTILYGSITGFTLAPEELPTEFDGIEQTDNLYEYVEESNDIGWIKKESVYDNLLDRIENIEQKLEEEKTNKAKEKLQDFVDYVQSKYEEDKLTKEARILLKQNANYIKRNL